MLNYLYASFLYFSIGIEKTVGRNPNNTRYGRTIILYSRNPTLSCFLEQYPEYIIIMLIISLYLYLLETFRQWADKFYGELEEEEMKKGNIKKKRLTGIVFLLPIPYIDR